MKTAGILATLAFAGAMACSDEQASTNPFAPTMGGASSRTGTAASAQDALDAIVRATDAATSAVRQYEPPPPPRFAQSFSFSDPRGDHLQLVPVRRLNPPGGVADVERLLFSFDRRTGEYEIKVTASPANPFVGDVRANILLFNPDSGTSAQNPAFFEDTLIISLATPTRTLTLTGMNPRLQAWRAGHRVAPCEGQSFEELGPCRGGLGLPQGVRGFGTGVVTLSGPSGQQGRDVLFTAPAARIKANS